MSPINSGRHLLIRDNDRTDFYDLCQMALNHLLYLITVL